VKTKKKKVASAKHKPAKVIAKTSPPKKTATSKAKVKAKAKPKVATSKRAHATPGAKKKWLEYVAKHGVVLASAKGPVPSLAEQIAGEPIVGSWWSHPKGKIIFEVLSAIDENVDVRSFKLVDGKVTFVHRRLWPAIVRLAREGVLPAERTELVRQEHTRSGEHHNVKIPFPAWVEEDVSKAADQITVDAARAQLGAWT
jgi:hypothetical protein